MSFILSYLFYFVVASLAPLQRRWLAKHKNPNNIGQILFSFQVTFIRFLLGLSLFLFEPFSFNGDLRNLIILAFIAGIFGALHFITANIAQKYVEAGATTLLGNIYTPTTIILSSVFLHESLNFNQITGTVMLLVGMCIVTYQKSMSKLKVNKYVMMTILSGIALGIALTAERGLQNITGFSSGTLVSWGMQCVMLGILTLILKEKHIYTNRDIAITGILRSLQSFSWVILVFVVGNISIVSSITTFKIVVIFIAAAIFLKEHHNLSQKIFGSLVSIFGLLLMI